MFFTEVDGLFLLLNIAGLKAHAGKLVKPDKCVTVGAVFNRDFRHLSRLETAPTDAFHLFYRYEPSKYDKEHLPQVHRSRTGFVIPSVTFRG